MKIRRAVLKDAGELMELRAGFNDFHAELSGKKPAEGWEKQYRKELIKELRSVKILKLVACEGQKAVGTAFCSVINHQPGTNAWLKSRKSGLIRFVYVREKFRGKGVAKALIGECLKWAQKQGAHEAELMVARNNDNAHGLYEKLGFEDQSVRMTKEI